MRQQKRGSALLIVLGMLSFLVISAVAFSAYMRYSRLPSSFLRRTVSSRMLVKAALARAIDEVDAAIGNNPHPNIGNKQYYYPRVSGGGSLRQNRNHWLGHVYMGGTNTADNIPIYSQESTVSPLCLEALAYIPAPLVNEARYYSRHSQAARWHELDYDAGRYAFCAIDVSDYFDVNALHADVPRLSTGSSRISLAYLFEDENHQSASPMSGMCTPQQWDDFMKNFQPDVSAADASSGGKGGNGGKTDDGSTLPLISVADFNLALNKYLPGSMSSPFCDYINKNSGSFYGSKVGSSDSPSAEALRRQTFITDSLMNGNSASTIDMTEDQKSDNSTEEKLDLSDDDNQPFDINMLTKDQSGVNYYSIIDYNSQGKASTELNKLLCGLGKCMLFDYLDKDNLPLSLAIPTVERIPMICGIDIDNRSGTLTIAPEATDASFTWKTPPGAAGAPCIGTSSTKYTLKGLDTVANVPLTVLVVFPFRNQLDDEDTFEVGGRVSYFLSGSENDTMVKMRTFNESDSLHLAANGGDPLTLGGYQMIDDAIASVPIKTTTIRPQDFASQISANGEKGALQKITLTPDGRVPQEISLGKFDYTWETTDGTAPDSFTLGQNPNPTGTGRAPSIQAQNFAVSLSEKCGFCPLKSDGSVMADLGSGIAKTMQSAYSKNFKLNMAVWVWIKSQKTSKVVDLVPACVYDDRDVNQLNSDALSLKWGQKSLGDAYPLMRFDLSKNGYSITVNSEGCSGNTVFSVANNGELEATPRTVYVGDPRFNHAPESWFYKNATDSMSEQDWLDNCGRRVEYRDGDIFMQTSDQGYMQSVYELCNLLRMQEFYTSPTDRGLYENPAQGDTTFRQGEFSAAMNSGIMWRTYDPFVYPNGTTPGDALDSTLFVSCPNGLKVSPYSSTNVLMAAFANTPLEWRFAADSDRTGGKIQSVWDNCGDVKTFNSKYVWNEYSTGTAKIDWLDLQDFAGEFIRKLNSNVNDQWADVYDELGWYNKEKRENGEMSKYLLNDLEQLADDNKCRIWNCDRKFLYGFWRECLSAKQQMFLVFVRAEPSMMGSGAAGATAPSLGARAMALVWRDPTATQEQNNRPAPHRTRILFYRQFD